MRKKQMPLILPFIIALAAAGMVYELQKIIGTVMFPVFDGGKTSDWSNTTHILMYLVMIAVYVPVYIFLYGTVETDKAASIKSVSVGEVLCVAAGACIVSAVVGEAIKSAAVAGVFPVFDNVEIILKDGNLILSILAVAIFAPVAEELIFRGLVFRSFRCIGGFWFAASMSSIVWAVIHLNLVQGIRAVIVGLCLSFIYEKYSRLWMPVLAHMSINITAAVFDYSGILRDMEFNIYRCVIMMLIMIAAIYIICRYINRKCVGDI